MPDCSPSTLRSPEQSPTAAVRAGDGFGSDDGQVEPPSRKTTVQERPPCPIGRRQPRRSRISLEDLELVAQSEVLEGQLLAEAQTREASVQREFEHDIPCYVQIGVTARAARRTGFHGGQGY